MQRRVNLFTFIYSLIFLGTLASGASFSEEKIRIVEPGAASIKLVDGLMKRGAALEKQQKWGEALTLYEEAIREHHQSATLREHFTLSKVQYGISRRYRDSSFRKSIHKLAHRQALEVFYAAAQKIDSYYVGKPNWPGLMQRGTYSLELALYRKVFREHNLPKVNDQKIAQFRSQLKTLLSRQVVRSRDDAYRTISNVSILAQRELGLNHAVVILEYTAGMINSLDNYSSFLTGDQLKEVFSQIEGNFVGLGIELKAADGALRIVNTISGSPAAKAGILAGDRVLSVDGTSTKNMTTDSAAEVLQGEEGTIARLLVVTGNEKPRELLVKRTHVDIPSVEHAQLIDQSQGVAYFKLTAFQKTTSRDVDAALWKLHRSGMKSLIIDLRGNPGGLLTASVEVADKFITAGGIVSTNGRSPQERFNYTAHKTGTWKVPLVVLIDGDSASASEIFAGAIQDHHRGTIVGMRSYGKGSVQGIFPLKLSQAGVKCGIRLTTAKFYSPSGKAISNVGVTPGIVVHQVQKPVDNKIYQPGSLKDPVISAAISAAQKALARR